jgi:rRNA-processing protein EBP2
MPKHKLKQALERVKGVDHHLEKQKKLRKEAEKKNRVKEAQKIEEVEEVNGGVKGLVDDEAEESSAEEEGAEWESEDEDEEDEAGGVAVYSLMLNPLFVG